MKPHQKTAKTTQRLRRLLASPFALMLSLSLSHSARSETLSSTLLADTMPPSWDLRDSRQSFNDVDEDLLSENRRKIRRTPRPWYKPRFALGVGLNVPEIVPIEAYIFFGRYLALRGFVSPSLPVNIRIEMPSDVISTKKGVGVAHPAYTIRSKAKFGPSYGGEALVFPFGGSFFMSLGGSYREMRLHGEAQSSVLACSLIEAAKEPPCGDPAARIETLTQLKIEADAFSSAMLLRAGMGWFWHIGNYGYFTFSMGATKPTRVKQNAKVSTGLLSPSGTDAEIEGALSQIQAESETDLENKALKAMRPTSELVLPVIGIATGVRF